MNGTVGPSAGIESWIDHAVEFQSGDSTPAVAIDVAEIPSDQPLVIRRRQQDADSTVNSAPWRNDCVIVCDRDCCDVVAAHQYLVGRIDKANLESSRAAPGCIVQHVRLNPA